MLTLRSYQEAAKAAIYEHLRTRDDNPCAVLPTASGKTPLLASICKDAVGLWNGRVLVLAHVKELLEQTTDKLRDICPEVKFGVYSAGLKRRDTEHSVIGLTATPFRLKSGMICGPDNILNHICYKVGVKELIRDGYLCSLVTKAGARKADTSGLHVRAGEFVAGELEDLMDQDQLVTSACAEIVALAYDRHSCLIFASGVKHGRHVAKVREDMSGRECGFVCGETPAAQREELLSRFRAGDLRYLTNVNVLTTGFDAPNIDCVALLAGLDHRRDRGV